MSTKHTPGPWTYNAGFSIEARDTWIAGCDSRGSNDNDEANARLIASAPALLAALESAQSYFNSGTRDQFKRAALLVDAAIAAARGEG